MRSDFGVGRRDFLKVSGASAAALGAAAGLGTEAAAAPPPALEGVPGDTKYPKLAIRTRYSPQRLAFAASAGYEGVVIAIDHNFDPDTLTDSAIDQALATAQQTGARIISLEAMDNLNHLEVDPVKRKAIRARFIRCMELGHRLGCKFVGTLSGGMANTSLDDQIKAYAEVINQEYMPVCEKLDLHIGHENWPAFQNHASTPASWAKLFALVPNPRYGLEFDPSHLVRQYINPIAAAWDYKDRIYAVHAKDTEIIEPVLQQVGIHGSGWWNYRIPGQGLVNWSEFINVLLHAKFNGGIAIEHEDPFWDEPNGDAGAELLPARKDGFILAARYLRQYLPARLGPPAV